MNVLTNLKGACKNLLFCFLFTLMCPLALLAQNLSINDVSIPEQNTGGTNFNFTVSLSAASASTVSVEYFTTDGSAQASSDYFSTSGRVTFLPGETSATISVFVSGDVLNEADENFTVILHSAVNGTITDSTGSGSIQNDDSKPNMSIGDAFALTASEGDDGINYAFFPVGISNPSEADMQFTFVTVDGSATVADQDYEYTFGVETIPAGETMAIIQVPVYGDKVTETNQVFQVQITADLSRVNLIDNLGDAQIVNDDSAPEITVEDVTVTETDSGTWVTAMTVSLNHETDFTVTVDVATSDQTATGGVDYESLSTTNITFNPGETTQNVLLTINGDVVDENLESFFVDLSNAANATIADAQGLVIITDNDGLPSVNIDDVSVTEGNVGSVFEDFTVSLSHPSSETINVIVSTSDGTASASSDYVDFGVTVTFNPGVTNQPVPIEVNGDLTDEGNEQLYVNLTAAKNAQIGDSQGTATIVDDDGTPQISISDDSDTEGNSGLSTSVFSVTLDRASANTISVNYTTADGTATATGNDYLPASGTLTFAPGVTNLPVSVAIRGDQIEESHETFTVNLSSAVNAGILDGSAGGTITNDDATPGVSIADITVGEVNAGSVNAAFTVTLSNPSAATITMDYVTSDGTAIAGSDYTAVTNSLSFAPGETSKTAIVSVLGDNVDEINETFTVDLINLSGASASDTQATGTIIDNDGLPTININDVSVSEGDSGTTTAAFTVSLSHPSVSTVTANIATVDATATAGSDYVGIDTILTFNPGETSQVLNITVNGDLVDEGSENFQVILGTPASATIGDGQGTGTINDDDNTPVVSISNVGVTEGDSGTVAAVFDVTLDRPSQSTVSVNYSSSNGTATLADSDYSAVNGTLNFSPGLTNLTVTVLVNGDITDEANESFDVTLSSPANATLGTSTGTGTITDDDGTPSISISDVTATEADSHEVNAEFTVTLSNPGSSTITVDYATSDDTALAGSDYAGETNTLSFAPGETSQTITLAVLGDLVDENTELFNVNLSNPTNAAIVDGDAIGRIIDNDGQPSVSIDNATVTEGNSGTATATLNLTLSHPSVSTITVNVATANGTALSTSDYVELNTTVTFLPGVTNQTVDLTVNGDLVDEENENLHVNLSNAVDAQIGDSQGVVLINDDDATPELNIDDVTVTEGDGGTIAAVFNISLTAPSAATVSVDYATADGTATSSGGDYLSANSTLTFAPGVTNVTLTVLVQGDTTTESNENFTVTLSEAVNATIDDGEGLATITNDDAAPGISINDIIVTEGDSGTNLATFTLSLDRASDSAVSVDIATADGTAVAGLDYEALSTTNVVFSAGQTSQQISVNVIGDTSDESNETFVANLSNASGASISDAQGEATIIDNDGTPSVSIDNATVTEGDSGTVSATFNVTLSNTSVSTITVDVATADGTANAGADYNALSTTVTFLAGETNQTVTVNVSGDLIDEGDENFLVTLSNAVNALIGDSQGTGTITDNDNTPEISIGNAVVTEGDGGTVAAIFDVTLDRSSSSTVSATYATSDGSATTADGDYVSANGTITFAPGVTNLTIAVLVNGDITTESDETLNVVLGNALNGTFADDTGTATISNDDAVPSISIADIEVSEGDSGTADAIFTLTLSNPSDATVSVDAITLDDTAVADGDYINFGTNNVIFNPGETTATLTVTVNGDTTFEDDETFLVQLFNESNSSILDGEAVGTILNDDSVPVLTIEDVAVTEGDSGTVAAVFNVNLSQASEKDVVVNYTTGNGTALSPSDYASAAGQITIAAGVTNVTISIDVNGDVFQEDDETFTVTLHSPVNSTINDAQATGTILNDDSYPGISLSDVTVTEGNTGTVNAVFTISLSSPHNENVYVNVSSADGTATFADDDYLPVDMGLIFTPGVTNRTVTVKVKGDIKVEADEAYTVVLSEVVNATVVDGEGIGTILNDDIAPTVTITSPLNGAIFHEPGPIVIAADASDSDGSVATVEFFSGTTSLGVDSDSPWMVSWPQVSPGTYNLTARATDNTGITTVSSVVTIIVNDVPDIYISRPFEGDMFFAPANIAISAWATDKDGTIVQVDFFSGTNYIGTDNTIPYTITWLDVPAGDYEITAQATDNDGGVGISAPIHIIVRDPVKGDFNGDGHPDILWRNSRNGQNRVWLMEYTNVVESLLIRTENNSTMKIYGVNDFNSDGKTDIVWRNEANGANTIWAMDLTAFEVDTTFKPEADMNWKVAGTGDFDGDGKSDIVWRNAATGQNRVGLMNGVNLAKYQKIKGYPNLNWTFVSVDDFDADGKPDILMRNVMNGKIRIWLMDGLTFLAQVDLPAETVKRWQIVGTADYDGDGFMDILWRHSKTGNVRLWLMDGTTFRESVDVSAEPDLRWKIVGPQ